MSSAPLTKRRFEFPPQRRPETRRGIPVNVSDTERLLSALGGAGLALFGLSRRSLGGLLTAAVGGSLIYRGATGHCSLYALLDINTAQKPGRHTSVPAGSGCRVEKTITVNRRIDEVFAYWRNLENLPRFMRHLEAVHNLGNKRSHWIARGPLGRRVEWDAEIITDHLGEAIAWRSLPGSDVGNAGSVHFQPAPGGRGTEVRVVLKYDPPAGKLGAVVAKMFGEDPERQIAEDLRSFKQLLETGETATTQGQPSGRKI